MSIRLLSAAAILAFASFSHQASAQSFFESLLKSGAEAAAKAATDSVAAKVGVPGAVGNNLVQTAAHGQMQQAAVNDPGCKKGQLINPYFVMLQANLLADASLADNSCVSSTQLQSLHSKYSKLMVK